jgi:hypothetical protein
MGNIFQTPLKLQNIYDIKGSEVGRTSKDENSFLKKDLDIKSNFKIGSENKKILMNQIRKDSEFLRDLKIIDYSLIVGVYEIDYSTHDNEIINLDDDDDYIIEIDSNGNKIKNKNIEEEIKNVEKNEEIINKNEEINKNEKNEEINKNEKNEEINNKKNEEEEIKNKKNK